MLADIEMTACPFCGSLDIDPQFWAAQKDEDGPIVHGPGCMDCGATAETVEGWNKRTGAPTATVKYRTDLPMHEPD